VKKTRSNVEDKEEEEEEENPFSFPERPLWDNLFSESPGSLQPKKQVKRQIAPGDPMFRSQWHLNR